ncbi:hypothetical protein [Kribbella sp. NPDC049584]|uniref:hypothetical protein n=1 Tax=Kribbella sp. NPDC049584 TaxID=3154833 RepID=UPI00343B8790
MAKPPGQALRTGKACAPFRAHLEQVRSPSASPSSWNTVQTGFLQAMQQFDDLVVAGMATEGERQNGKGDYFNDLLAVILENASGATLNRRSGVGGLIFPNHNLDVTYPPTGQIVDVLVEAKMLGTPQHPGNASTQKVTGRPGSADMLKRCKEAGFKTIDLKAAYGMLQSASGVQQQEGITGDLTSWLRTAKPKSYLVAGIRVVSKQDADAAITMSAAMTQVMDGVGIFLYSPRGYMPRSLRPADYEPVPVPSHLELVRVLQRVTQDLSAARVRFAAAGPETSDVRPPSASVREALSKADVEPTSSD